MKTINLLNELNIKVLDDYQELLNTDFIFVPIKDEEKIVVSKNKNVLKGDLLYSDDNIKRYSSISGKYMNIVEFNKQKFMVVKNDYKELTSNTRARNLDNVTKEKFMSLISDLPLKNIFENKINTLYINAIDDDPLTYNKYMYLKEDIKDIALMTSYLSNTFKIRNIKYVIKNSYSNLLKDYNVSISYLKVADIYPIGNPLILRKHLIKDQNSYLIDLNDIIDLIYIVKKNKVRLEKLVTINGNIVDNPKVLRVKKYSYLNNLLTNFNFKEKKYDVILNNSLCGEKINPKNTVISSVTDSIIINKKEKEDTLECSKCSLCYNICPMNINPLEKNSKCIKCGLCNFVCPSKINVYERNQK